LTLCLEIVAVGRDVEKFIDIVIFVCNCCYGSLLWYVFSVIPFSIELNVIIIYICIKNIESCLYVGHSLSKESDIVVIACQNVGDCHVHSSALPCDPEYISCYQGYCVCYHKTFKPGTQI